MAGLYVDTSALGRVVLDEPEAPAIRKTLASYRLTARITGFVSKPRSHRRSHRRSPGRYVSRPSSAARAADGGDWAL